MNESFHLENIYDSQFFRNPQGQMLVSPQILMPSLRSIPIFSTNNMKPGDSWQAMGEEIHEGILVKENILHFNVAVYYKYIGEEEIGGKTFSEISIDYHVMHYPKQDPDIFSFTGFSHSLYYWDQSNSIPVYYNEDYSFMFTLRNGETVLYTGTTESQEEIIADITNQQKQAIITEISNTIRNMSVRDTADGIIVNLGNILFDLNQSAIKTEFEKKLDQMSDILRKYPQIDLAVSGHTDNSGSEKFNQSLSEDRAKSVADSLIKRGISPSRISYIGSGSKTPLTDNSSEEKRSINRRVEIKLITKE